MRLVRWKAVLPLSAVLVTAAVLWWMFLDTAIERAIETAGAEIVGARVDVAAAHLSLRRGSLRIEHLEVANPDRPMTNLVELGEIVAQVRWLPLLEKKLIVDTAVIRGVRFGTPRRYSGALAHPSPTSRRLRGMVAGWASRLRVPALSLEGFSTVLDLSRLSADSLRAVTLARTLASQGDSLAKAWREDLDRLDPRAELDSTQALMRRLEQADLKGLGVGGARDLLAQARNRVRHLRETADSVNRLANRVQSGLDRLRQSAESLPAARESDYRYARSLVHLPSLDAPDLSPALLGDLAVERLEPILYWLALTEQYLPPGLDPRRAAGPKRLRASGTTVRFPKARTYPDFLLSYGGADAVVEAGGAVSGRYAATITGLTSAPSLYGRPTRLSATRTGTGATPASGSVLVVLDHVRAPVRDSVKAMLDGVSLPGLALPVAGARVELGQGFFRLDLVRQGDRLEGSLAWRASGVKWRRADSAQAAPAAGAARGLAPLGTGAWAQELLWRALSRLDTVEVEVRVAGRAGGPGIGVRSNLGREAARALRQEIGAEVDRQERRVREEVDRLARPYAEQAQRRIAAAESEIGARVRERQAELEAARADLERKIQEATRRLPVRIP